MNPLAAATGGKIYAQNVNAFILVGIAPTEPAMRVGALHPGLLFDGA